jgi:hypothetical protein
MTQIQTTDRIHQISSKPSGNRKFITARIRTARAIRTRRASRLHGTTIPWSSTTFRSLQIDILSQQMPVRRIQRPIRLTKVFNHRRKFIQPGFDRLRPKPLLGGPSLRQVPIKGPYIVHTIVELSR